MNKLSSRINKLSESQTLAMTKKARELQEKGFDVISLSIGEPDFNTPDFIKEAAKKAIDDNFTKYTPVSGYVDLKQAVAEKFKRDNNIHYDANQIVVSTGAKQCLANAVLCLVNQGDEVIVPIPYWVSYIEIIKLADGIPVEIPTTVKQNYKFTPEQLEKAITPKTKMLIFSTPCNPSGSVYSKAELKALADVIIKYPNIYVICDEIYEHINYVEGHESMAQFPEVYDRVITVNGVSKGFAMTGWRIGYMGAAKWIADACDKMQGQFTSGACSIAQRAALAAVKAPKSVTTPMCEAFKKRRDIVIKLLNEIPGVKTYTPEGAYYIFPDISYYFGKKHANGVISNSLDLCNYILEEGHVALVSGDAFGDNNCFRFSYATSEDKIIESIRRIKEVLAKLN